MIKRFILSSGEKLIDILAILSLIVVILAGLGVGFQEGFFAFLIFEIVGLAYIVIMFFFIYLLLDIRDLLKKIEENTKGGV